MPRACVVRRWGWDLRYQATEGLRRGLFCRVRSPHKMSVKRASVVLAAAVTDSNWPTFRNNCNRESTAISFFNSMLPASLSMNLDAAVLACPISSSSVGASRRRHA